MAQQATIRQLLNLLDGSVNSFVDGLPEIQRATFDKLITLLKEVDVRDGTIQNSVRNIRLLGSIKKELDDLVLSNKYLNSVKEFVTAYGTVARLNDRYFSEVADRYKPPAMLSEVRKQAVNDAVSYLTESGIGANYTDKLRDMIKTAITSGGSYATLTESLRQTILGGPQEDGALVKYARQIATDGINQFNRTYMKAVTDDLGFKWFRYTGSNLRTSRPFCLAMTQPENEYFHISQVSNIIKGYLNTGKVSTQGLNKETNTTNFFIYAGGYNCGHSIIPVPDALVPERFKAAIVASETKKLPNIKIDAFGSGTETIKKEAGKYAEKIGLNGDIEIKAMKSSTSNGGVKFVEDADGNYYLDTNTLYLNINREGTMEDVVRTMVHEMTHLKQGQEKRLVVKPLRGTPERGIYYWDGKPVLTIKEYEKIGKQLRSNNDKIRDAARVKYRNLPWENEAYNAGDNYENEELRNVTYKEISIFK